MQNFASPFSVTSYRTAKQNCKTSIPISSNPTIEAPPPKRIRPTEVPVLPSKIDRLGTIRGMPDINPHVSKLHHQAAHLLHRIASNGVPVLQSTPPWTASQLQAAISRGSHKSTQDHQEFLNNEMADMIEQNHWVVLPYNLIKHLPNLRLSPMGVVPQRDRRPRVIVDYSFYNINADTVPLAPIDSMQFGRTLERILYRIHHSDKRFGPVFMIKIDIADGFYRVLLASSHIPTLGVCFPTRPNEEPLVAFPLVLPMGWISSPPYFCALTETAADLANVALQHQVKSLPHPLSTIADTAIEDVPVPRRLANPTNTDMPTPTTQPTTNHPLHTKSPNQGPKKPSNQSQNQTPQNSNAFSNNNQPITTPNQGPNVPSNQFILQSSTALSNTNQPTPNTSPYQGPNVPSNQINNHSPRDHKRSPLAYIDLYMDDFIGLAQGHPGLRNHVRSTLLHSIDKVLRPLDHTDQNTARREPISIKKLNKGDGKWATRKVLLGWVIDTINQTIELPTHRADRLRLIIADLLSKKRVSLKSWQQQLGELRSMILAVPGGTGLFSHLYTGLTQVTATTQHRVRINHTLRNAILDLQHLTNDLGARPTRFGEIVDTPPIAYSTADACGQGMGGVWLPCDPTIAPLLWRQKFPQSVQSKLVTDDNRNGTISNSDLELAAQLATHDILVHKVDCREHTISTFTDNISARAWQRKKARTTTGPAAFLLRLHSLHQRHHRYRATIDYLPGPLNTMADDASPPTLDLINPTARDEFRADHQLAMQEASSGVVPNRAQSRNSTWLRWTKYCADLHIDPLLTDIPDKIPILQVFASRYRSGNLAPNQKPVRAKTVATTLCSIGQTMATLGAPDARLDSSHNLHYVLQQQLKSYAKQDVPASRVKPIPFSLIEFTYRTAITPLDTATADMAMLGFFFLLRPGEHTQSSPTSDTTPFRLMDVTFHLGSTILEAPTASIDLISRATFVCLRFTRQKNGVENEIVGHARSGHSSTCPVLALIRRVLHLRSNTAPPTSPLCRVYLTPTITTHVTSANLTSLLRISASTLFNVIGFPPSDISARALRAGGAMALLCAHVDSDIIRLVGRWRSDEMLRYLHLQAFPQMRSLAPLMVAGGSFRLLNHQPIPPAAAAILQQVPTPPPSP